MDKKNAKERRVLVVDDEADIRELLDLTLVRMGLDADCAGSIQEAKAFLEKESYNLCLTDMRLPDGEGIELVKLIAEQYPETPVAVITAFGCTDNAVAALKAGAFDYLAKPVALDQLRTLIKSAVSVKETPKAPPAKPPSASSKLVGHSASIAWVASMIEKLARSQAPVYISGESGSGKEMAARLIHEQGARAEKPFVPVNCGAIPETLMESEFFGYKKGAFTGADSDREGFFQAANGGTLFLDEVADLPLAMQVKLLRAIQEKKIRKIGATQEEPVDVRLLCATHQKLAACVEAGTFRQDLYYRLNVIELKMPALRERKEDIPLLVEFLLDKIGGGRAPEIDRAALDALANYAYPGNVRELENILERAMALCVGNIICEDDLQLTIGDAGGNEVSGSRDGETLDDLVNRVERQAILEALEKTGFNRTAAARLLGVTFRSLRYRIERLGIEEGGA